MFRKQVLFLLLLVLVGSDCRADIQDSRNQLKKIQQRIENARIDLQQKRRSELHFSRELAVLKRTLQQLKQRISKLRNDQKKLQAQIDEQKQQIETGKLGIRRTGRRLEKRLIALYKEGEIGPLKILFSADSPTELVQQYHYLTRVLQHDRQLLEEYRTALEVQQQQLKELEDLQQQKLVLLDKEQQQQKVADDGRRLQSRLLKQVKAEKKQLQQELVKLKERSKRLQGLIARLQRESVSPPAAGAGSFSSGKGKLAWPVNGEVLIGFGTQKDKSLGTYYESNGIEITVAPGSVIRAVADGKVVFADWFKGYGNLLILNHPGGFHTLYAQTDQLNKTLGSQVRAGEVVGKSGLGGRDSIYFEIRQNGSPVNPLKWLQRR